MPDPVIPGGDTTTAEARARRLLSTWTDPAFCRPPIQELALGCARDVLALVAALSQTEREVGEQMASKLEAQMVLKAITDALCLRFSDLGMGWREAAPKILSRLEEIVDEADRGFRERDAAEARLADAEKALRRCAEEPTGGVAARRYFASRPSADDLTGPPAANPTRSDSGEEEPDA